MSAARVISVLLMPSRIKVPCWTVISFDSDLAFCCFAGELSINNRMLTNEPDIRSDIRTSERGNSDEREK